MSKYVCTICGYVYDEAAGIPEAGIAPGTKWAELPDSWKCPVCGAAKGDFKQLEEIPAAPAPSKRTAVPAEGSSEALRELSGMELSALCSNLAKGCEKQYLAEEAGLFSQLAGYFQSKAAPAKTGGTPELLERIARNLEEDYPRANGAAGQAGPDRGALRALVWSEKVTRMLQSLLSRYEKEGPAFLEHTNVYVCDICGFIYIGDAPPEICPVCKVPKLNIVQLPRAAAV